MKKIVITSDSHGDAEVLFRILQEEADADAMIFLGDGFDDLESLEYEYPNVQILAVPGNCDHNWRDARECTAEFEGVRIFYTHGHMYGVKQALGPLASAAAERGASVALFGHTHMAEKDEIRGVTLFNPGSVSRPVGRRATYGVALCENGQCFLSHKTVPEA